MLFGGQHYITDQKMLQKRATRLVPSLREAECLSHLRLPSLYYRSRQGDITLVYQILHGLLLNVDASFFSPNTYTPARGHNFKLFKESFNKFARTYKSSNQ